MSYANPNFACSKRTRVCVGLFIRLNVAHIVFGIGLSTWLGLLDN